MLNHMNTLHRKLEITEQKGKELVEPLFDEKNQFQMK